MKEYEYLDELISRYPVLAPVKADIRIAYETMKECYERGGKLLIAGNGGSCADSEHIVGELMKGFVKKRLVSAEIEAALKTVDPQMGAELSEKLQQGLPAIALTGHAGLTTAFMNDVDGSMTYAEQVLGYGKEGDVFLGISTSGNSKNVLYAAVTACRKSSLRAIRASASGCGALTFSFNFSSSDIVNPSLLDVFDKICHSVRQYNTILNLWK